MPIRTETILLSLLLVSLTGLPFVPASRLPHAHADPANPTLYGDFLQGWGSTLADIRSPGPEIVVSPGELVMMNLFSADSPVIHNFGVDYNGNGAADLDEPVSSNFNSRTVARGFQFQATTTPGDYTYWCFIHLSPMFGNFRVVALHDLAVTGISVSRPFAYSGVNSQPIKVNVTVANQGSVSETSTVTASAGASTIGTQSATVAAGGSTTVTFNWDAHLLARGTYTLSAQVAQVPGETDLLDNSLTDGSFTVRFGGDVNNDCAVNGLDLGMVGAAFLSTPASSNWNAAADINNDSAVNGLDLGVIGANFLKSCV